MGSTRSFSPRPTRWCRPARISSARAPASHRGSCGMRPNGAASLGFHLRHVAGSLDRLLTYARGAQLDDRQHAALKREAEPGTPPDGIETLLEQARSAIDAAIAQLAATRREDLLQPRTVGRAALPSTVLGLLFHAAEHTTRHVGQAITTAKIVSRERRVNAIRSLCLTGLLAALIRLPRQRAGTRGSGSRRAAAHARGTPRGRLALHRQLCELPRSIGARQRSRPAAPSRHLRAQPPLRRRLRARRPPGRRRTPLALRQHAPAAAGRLRALRKIIAYVRWAQREVGSMMGVAGEWRRRSGVRTKIALGPPRRTPVGGHANSVSRDADRSPRPRRRAQRETIRPSVSSAVSTAVARIAECAR